MAPSARSRRLRWVAPFATAAVVALIVALPGLSAAASPSLPPITAQQLLAKVQQSKVSNLSGTLNLSTNLGIPNLSELSAATSGGGHGAQAFSPTDLLSGSHQARVWLAGPDKARVALLRDMAETDVVHNGQNVWTWDSTTKKVTHYTLAAHTSSDAGAQHATDPAEPVKTLPVKTPQQEAQNLLARLTPSTSVSVAAPVDVAGQKAYQLVLAPHSAASTIDHVTIAVDSVTGLPLQVQIFAKGQKSAAVKLGFGSISYSTPAASEFSFTPPPGSTVTNKTDTNKTDTNKTVGGADKPVGAEHANGPDAAGGKTGTAKANSDQQATVGHDWTTVAVFNHVNIPAQFNDYLNAATPVSGRFGQGKVLGSSLVNVLVLNDGRVALGAVNASTLEAALAPAP